MKKLLRIEEICLSPSFALQKCSLLSVPFTFLSGVQNSIAQENAALMQSESQLKANREQIAAQKEENDKAYVRNNSLGQLAQLMAAGLSEQQARQVIASNASTGPYEPAQIRSEMEGVDLGAAIRARGEGYANMLNTTGQTIAQTGSEFLTAFTSYSGGALGAAAAAPFMSDITPYMHLINREKVHSGVDFKNWVKALDPESEAGKVFKPMLESKNWKRIERFAPAMKSFNSNFMDLYTSQLDSNQRFNFNQRQIDLTYAEEALKNSQEWQTQRQTMMYDAQTGLLTQQYKTEIEQTKLTQQKVLGEKYDALMKKLGYQRESELYDVVTESQKQQFIAQAQNAVNETRLKSDPMYIEMWLKSQMSSAQGEYFLNLLNACENRMKYNIMVEDPQMHYILSVYNALNQAGLSKGLVGQFVSGTGITHVALDRVAEAATNTFNAGKRDTSLEIEVK